MNFVLQGIGIAISELLDITGEYFNAIVTFDQNLLYTKNERFLKIEAPASIYIKL